MAYRLGVDIGTTFTAAAVANGAAPSMLGLGNRALQIPSVLFLTDESDFLFGEAAERRGLSEPDRVVREFKRRIGDPVPLLVAGTPFSPEILTARLLRWVVGSAGNQMGERPKETIVTHPANWGPYKLDLLEQAVSMADIGPSRRCSEPVAAAARYAARARVGVGDLLAVYDLGGGTFDACVLEQTSLGFRLLGTPEGIEHLGGVDFDEALFGWVLRALEDSGAELDVDDPAVTIGLARLRRDVVEAKEALSSDQAVTLVVGLPGLNRSVRITRPELEAIIRPALRTTVESFARTVRSAGLTADQLSAIVLIGGSSRIPLVGEMLQREFGVHIAVDTHPKHDVALGAMLVGPDPAVRWTRTGPAPDSDSEVLPVPSAGLSAEPAFPIPSTTHLESATGTDEAPPAGPAVAKPPAEESQVTGAGSWRWDCPRWSR